MDPKKKADQLDEVTTGVLSLLEQIIARRGRDKRVSELKIAVLLYIRIAYQLGSEHVMRDIIEGSTRIGASNGNGGGT